MNEKRRGKANSNGKEIKHAHFDDEGFTRVVHRRQNRNKSSANNQPLERPIGCPIVLLRREGNREMDAPDCELEKQSEQNGLDDSSNPDELPPVVDQQIGESRNLEAEEELNN